MASGDSLSSASSSGLSKRPSGRLFGGGSSFHAPRQFGGLQRDGCVFVVVFDGFCGGFDGFCGGFLMVFVVVFDGFCGGF